MAKAKIFIASIEDADSTSMMHLRNLIESVFEANADDDEEEWGADYEDDDQ